MSGRKLPAADVVDVFAYVIVLNLATQFVPAMITETFLLSLLTAVLLKVVLEVVVAAKNRVKVRFTAAPRRIGKALAAASLVVVMAGSKFVVLELVALLFGDSVRLGGFFAVTALILLLMLTRAGVRRLLATPTS
ncbi:MAG TPA: hypothetical protein VFR88_02950 [Microlunatus sp.]|nr:hypothetical protein [Microlunatus sp.]